MKRSKFTEEQVIYEPRQAEAGGGSALRRLRQLKEDMLRLKRLVVDLSLGKYCCRRRSEQQPQARLPPGTGPVVSRHLLVEGFAKQRPGSKRAEEAVCTS